MNHDSPEIVDPAEKPVFEELRERITDWGGKLTLLYGVFVLAHFIYIVFRFGGDDHLALISNIVTIIIYFGPFILALRVSKHAELPSRTRRAWLLIALAYLTYTAASVLWLYFENVLETQPFPSLADVGYLAYYPLMLAGLLCLGDKLQTKEELLKFTLDVCIVLIGGGMILWYFLLGPIAETNAGDDLVWVLSLAYPIGDLVLLLGIASLLLRNRETAAAVPVNLLLLGMVINFFTDFAFSYQSLQGTYQTGNFVDAMYSLACFPVIAGAYIQHRNAMRGDSRHGDRSRRVSARVTWLPYAAIAVGYGTILKFVFDQPESVLRHVIAAAAVLTGFVVVRQVLAMRENVKANTALADLQERFQGIYAASKDAIGFARFDGTLVDVNDALIALTGFEKDELLAGTYQDLTPVEYQLADETIVADIIKTGRPAEYEKKLLRKDGKEVAVAVTVFAVKGKHGDPIGLAGIIRDITERKFTQDKLKEAEERWQLALGSSRDGIWDWNFRDNKFFYSPRWREMFGYGEDEDIEIDPTDWEHFFHPDDRHQARQIAVKLASGRTPFFDIEFRHRCKDGSYKWVQTRGQGIRGNKGRGLARLIGLHTDITERKRTDETLRESEEKFRSVTQSAAYAIVASDEKGQIVSWNDGAQKIFGYDESEILGKPLTLLIPEKYRAAHRDGIKRNVENGESPAIGKTLELQGLRKDGGKFPLELSLSTWKSRNGTFFSGIISDITERKRAETERRVISEIIQGVTATANLDELLALIYRWLFEVLDAENCFIALHDKGTGLFSMPFFVDKYDQPPPACRLLNTRTRYVFTTESPLLITKDISDRLVEEGAIELVGTAPESWLGTPLRTPTEVIGVLVVQNYEDKDAYSERDLQFLKSVGDQIAIAIERKRTEVELKTNEMQLREAQRIAGLGSWKSDLITNKTWWSDELYNIVGLQKDGFEATLESFLPYVHPDDRDLVRSMIDKAVDDQLSFTFEHRIIRPDGTVRAIHCIGKVIVDENGRSIEMVGTAQDITERKRAEEEMSRLNREIESHRRRLNDIVENTPCVIWEVPLDPENTSADPPFVNGYISEMYGYTPAEWLSTPDFWSSAIHPDDREEMNGRFERLFADGRGSQQNRWLTKDGRVIWGDTHIVVVRDQTGKPVGLRGVTNDITELKEAEEALRLSEEQHRLLFETNPQPALVYDLETFQFLAVNEAAVRHYGYSRDEFLSTLTIKDIRPPEDIPVFLEKVSKVSPERDIILAPSRHKKKNGTVVDVEITSHVLNFSDRRAEIVLINDITERKKAEEQLKIFNEKLQQSNRELQDFAYVASHDLQEPLRKVQTFADRLRSKYTDKLDDSGLDYLERMRSAAQRMQTLIQDLLSFSRVATKAQPFVPVNLEGLTREVLSDLEVSIEQSSATIEFNSLPTIDADPSQMRQLIQNLVGNAIKFRRPGVTPLISITGESKEHSNGDGSGNGNGQRKLCRIVIRDNGIGFDEKYLDKIFTVFQRLHGRTEYEGSGIGLAVCRRIVERHHGTITAESTPGSGSRFIVTLPLSNNHSEVEQ